MKIGNYKLKIVLVAILILAIILSTYYFIPRSAPSGTGSSTSTPVPSADGATEQASTLDTAAAIKSYEYTQTYSDSTYNFSFKYPEGFTVTTIPLAENGETVLVESSDKKVGIQILVLSYGSDVDITEAMVRSDIRDMKISDSQTVEIGAKRKGLAFMSDNPAFGGQSREVWFVWSGNLYQISTYAEHDEFLKKMFSTWQFTK